MAEIPLQIEGVTISQDRVIMHGHQLSISWLVRHLDTSVAKSASAIEQPDACLRLRIDSNPGIAGRTLRRVSSISSDEMRPRVHCPLL